MSQITAIYALCEPDFTPRYVGKTIRYLHERHKAHIAAAKRPNPRLPVHRWMRKRMAAHDWLVIRLLEYVPAGEDWAAREKYWIHKYREEGRSLLNLTDGGEGLPGLIFSVEHKNNIAASIRTGATFSCESCGTDFWRKNSAINKGNCRFCSRACYAKSLRGVSRPVSLACKAAGIQAAALSRAAKTHCKRGHPLSGENLFLTSNNARGCKACRKIHKITYRSRHNG